MDAFYASVELRRRPELTGKPVVVCGSGPRAVVTTASYEARKLAGIHSAMPAAVARRRLPDAVYLRPDFTAYREASREVMAILRRNAETVEVVGLDEAYVDLTGLFSPKATMRRIASEIREETGLSCSVGISESRMLAKITSELGKPAGLVVLSRAEALERFAGESPGLVPGIGPKTVARLERMGIRTLAELARPRRGRARAGLRAAHRRLAAPPRPARRRDPGHGRARDEVAVDRDHLRRRRRRPRGAGRLDRLARRGALPAPALARPARPHDRDQGPASTTGPTSPARTRLERPTDDPARVTEVALELLRAYSPPRPVRLLGVRVAQFGDGDPAGEGDPEPQMRLSLPGSAGEAAASGSRARRRGPGSAGAPWSPR